MIAMAEANGMIAPADLVAALYRQLLMRPADPLGLAGKIAAVEAGDVSVDDLIRQFTGSPEFVNALPNLLAEAGTNDLRRFTNDVSQFGEVWELIRLWTGEANPGGLIVDVGARGRDRSNSYDLLRHFGWRGVLVEANPALLPELQRDFAGLNFVLVSCAVSDFTGRSSLTLGVNADVSSLNSEIATQWGVSPGAVEVDVRRLGDILTEQGVADDFDVLSLDIEGEDIKALNDLIGTTSYRPRWVVIEASNDFQTRSLGDGPFSRAVKEAYELRGQTRANLILRRRDPLR
jgi:FkbM family methyltransferase